MADGIRQKEEVGLTLAIFKRGRGEESSLHFIRFIFSAISIADPASWIAAEKCVEHKVSLIKICKA